MPEQIVSIYRRIATLRGARASLAVLARDWGVVIKGRIGHYDLVVFEQYRYKGAASNRVKTINRQHTAIVDSVEQFLFPRTYAVGFIPERFFKQILKQQLKDLKRGT